MSNNFSQMRKNVYILDWNPESLALITKALQLSTPNDISRRKKTVQLQREERGAGGVVE